jgi:hypothetical protein
MTAVEFYNSKVIELMKKREQGTIDVLNFRNELDQVFEQAKEMEKEQIKDAYYKGGDDLTKMNFIESEQYYKLTFKSE